MPKRTDIQSIMIIGAGPIVIGQACEFDYSGAQACKALREEGYRVILVNSNPATIMTDPGLADATYIEPITPEVVAKIIEKERPDALLPTMGGQTGLNTSLALEEMGVLEKFGVEMIGAKRDAIEMAEDRKLFREAMDRIGLENPKATIITAPKRANGSADLDAGVQMALDELEEIGLPAIIRPAFTLGGTGGGVAYNREDYIHYCRTGMDASPVNQILVDESLLGWKEFEMEVVRDKADNAIIVCAIENVDPMGVHTGDSITVAPALTLTDKEYQIMRNGSIAVLREIGVETGGSNVQWAVNPEDGRMVVIEMNPRVSRSSALASKATGFPIAKIAAKLAVGYTLDELDNDITKVTPASFEPTIDYVVTKIPKFAFEKFPGSEPYLTTAMKSVGEAMAIGRTIHESLQKALASMESGLTGFDEVKIEGAPEKLTSKGFAKGWRRALDWVDWIEPDAWVHEHNFQHHYKLGEDHDPDQPELNLEFLRDSRIPMPIRYAIVGFFMMTWKYLYYAPNTTGELHYHQEKKRKKPGERLELFDIKLWLPFTTPGWKLWARSWVPYFVFRFVVLPAPFGPRSTSASPGARAKSRSVNTVRSPRKQTRSVPVK